MEKNSKLLDKFYGFIYGNAAQVFKLLGVTLKKAMEMASQMEMMHVVSMPLDDISYNILVSMPLDDINYNILMRFQDFHFVMD